MKHQPSRRDSLRQLSFIISKKLYRLGESYIDRDLEIPIEFVERIFDSECSVARIRGGPLKRLEMQNLINVAIPKALAKIEADLHGAAA
jgi:hypothetical protein